MSSESTLVYCPWFTNFRKAVDHADGDFWFDLDTHLAPYNCKDVDKSPCLEFDTEQDYLMFLLKFS